MRLDTYGNPIFNSDDVFSLLYQGNIDKLKNIVVDKNQEIYNLENTAEVHLSEPLSQTLSISEFDKNSQDTWFMPEQYLNLDIEKFLIDRIDPNSSTQVTRVLEELAEFDKREMYPLLRWLVYFVDTCIENNIVWGVGRGSSVSSYVLYLIGVHKIDSLKYNLSWTDFLR